MNVLLVDTYGLTRRTDADYQTAVIRVPMIVDTEPGVRAFRLVPFYRTDEREDGARIFRSREPVFERRAASPTVKCE